MSYLFDDASDQYLHAAFSDVSGIPVSMACWFNIDTDARVNRLMSLDKETTGFRSRIGLLGRTNLAGDPLRLRTADVTVGNIDVAATSTGITLNQWHHGLGTIDASGNMAVYIDGGSKGTGTTTTTDFANQDHIWIGTYNEGDGSQNTSGKTDHVAIWNVPLTDAEAAQLGIGVSPLLIRPLSLKAYWMLVGGVLVDVIGGVTLTNNGATVDPDHSPLFYPDYRSHIDLLPPTSPVRGGSYLFDDASSEYLSVGSAVVTAAPYSVVCWAKIDTMPTAPTLFTLADDDIGTRDHYAALAVQNSTSKAYWSVRGGAPVQTVFTTTTITAGLWHHFCGVEAATNDRRVYLDGAGKSTGSTAITPSGFDRTSVGTFYRLAPSNYMSGNIDHLAVYGIALTDAEVAQLALGVSPLLIRPTGLVAYWMLVGGILVDVIGGVTLTNNGATVDPDHSPLWYPQASDTWHASAGAAAVSVALLRRRGRA